MRSTSCIAVGVWLCIAISSGSLTGQQLRPPVSEPAEVLILGTYHFDNPGLDVVQVDVADVLSPQKQAEVEAVVAALAEFRPTKVAVEARAAAVPRMNELYRSYRAGDHTLSRNEIQQLGFRIADRFGHSRLYGIDHAGEFPFDAVMAYAQEHDPEFLGWVQEKLGDLSEEANRQQRESTLVEMLRRRNDPTDIARGHGLYMVLAGVAAGDTYAGADLLARWYERNIRIFADLRALAQPGDRILVLFGSGHTPILRELVISDPALNLVEANDYLPQPRQE